MPPKKDKGPAQGAQVEDLKKGPMGALWGPICPLKGSANKEVKLLSKHCEQSRRPTCLATPGGLCRPQWGAIEAGKFVDLLFAMKNLFPRLHVLFVIFERD